MILINSKISFVYILHNIFYVLKIKVVTINFIMLTILEFITMRFTVNEDKEFNSSIAKHRRFIGWLYIVMD